MNRRKFVLGLGATAAAGATALGSGAFTSVKADRSVTVNVAGDSDAFLALEPIDGSPNSEEFVDTDGGTLAIQVTDTGAGGKGVNGQAVYLFDDLFRVTNRGTQGVYVFMRVDSQGVNFYRLEDGDRRQIDAGPTANGVDNLGDIGPRPKIQYLGVGESIRVGLGIDTVGTPFDRDGTVTIIAESDSEELPSGGGWDRESHE